MGQINKFDSSIGKLQIRISDLKPRLREIVARLDSDLERPGEKADLNRKLSSIRRECSDVLISLKSLFEIVASGKSKPDPVLVKKVQSLKRDHEKLVDELAACMSRLQGETEAKTRAAGANGATATRDADILVEGGNAPVAGIHRDPANHSAALEEALDQQASIRAQYDLLALKFERLKGEHKEVSSKLAKHNQESQSQEDAYKAKLAELARELEQARGHRDEGLTATASLVGALLDKIDWLESRLDQSRPLLLDALAEELDIYREEEVFLNPRLVSALSPSKKQLAKLVKTVTENELFDPAYYLQQLPETARKTDLLLHYLTEGWREGKSPHPLFSVPFYLMRNQQLARDGIEPLTHYIETGSKELKDPHPLFSTQYYASRVDESAEDMTWLSHFLQVGPSPPSPHPLFDPVEYSKLAKIPDSHTAIALLHYVSEGWKEGKFAFSPLFDVDHYKSQFGGNIDIEPYLHYALFGAAHGISPHPLFDLRHYLHRATELDPLAGDPLLHYLFQGERDGTQPSVFFSPKFYRDKHLAGATDQSALLHYLSKGGDALNDPHPHFNATLYREIRRELDPKVQKSDLADFINGGLRQAPVERIVNFLKERNWKTTSNPVKSEPKIEAEQKPAPASLIKRQYPGKVAYQAGKPNVLIVAHIAGEHLFGSERSFLDMVDAIGRIPSNVFVVLPRNVPDYTNAIRPLCHRVYIVDYKWWRKGEIKSDNAIAAFSEIITADNIHAVHVNTIMLREPLEAAKKCAVPGIVHVRELIQHDKALITLIGETPEEIIRQTKDRADWVIGNSDITALAFAKEDRTVTIPNTIDVHIMDIANEVSDEEIRFGIISSNIPKKGLSDVVELARLAADRVEKAKFVIIGPDTDFVLELKEQQKSGLIPDNVVFAGYASSPRHAVEQVNVVLNFSHFAESFGRTVLEAMAARRPVIAYKWGAIPELVEHQKSGFLVPYMRTADALPFVEQLCNQPAVIGQLGERGRQIAVAKFGLESYRSKMAEAYARILPEPALQAKSGDPLVRPARNPTIKTRDDRPRIAYFCWHFPVPSETFVLNELEALVADGADVLVFCRQTPWKDFKPSFPITFERVDSHKQLAKRLKETSRTIVHAHFVYPVVTDMVWPACEEAEIPFTFIAHAQDIFRYDNDKRNRLAEIGASKWCRALFTLSRFHLDFVVERGFPREKVIINPNAVDTKRFSAAYDEARQDRSAKTIIAVHRFVKKKGLDLLIRAAPLVADLGVKIEIYGYGDMEEEYRRLVAETGASNVEIKGALTQDDVILKMKTGDLFAAPSVRTDNGDMDGIPTSVVESMAAGVPVLTTNVAGIPDLVIDGITGIVVDPTVEGIAQGIRRFYGMPSLKVRAMIRTGAERARERHDVRRLTRVLMRVWRNETIDLLIVAWNNLLELKMVVERILENTSLPYHLIICDNQSQREPVGEYLEGLWREQDRVTVIHNNVNAMVGPGTNAALAQGASDYAVYICGKEGVSFARGWEIPIVHALEEQPAVGLVGTIGYSPTYLHGSQYPTGIELFPKFRNKEFATDNPSRQFGHIQGGLFGMRRKMVTEIGGFSDEVPHNYTDVEYSYYAESKGWKLANVPGMLALFNKSRPTLSQRFDESHVVAHPVLPGELERYDAVSRNKLKHCNICDWYGASFEASDACPSCGCSADDRTAYRWLSDGILMYRRLPALALELNGRFELEWSRQFQGPRLTMQALLGELKANGRLANRSNSFHLSLVRSSGHSPDELRAIATELKRLLTRGGVALFQTCLADSKTWTEQNEMLTREMGQSGFKTLPEVVYSSAAVNYSSVPLTVFEKQ